MFTGQAFRQAHAKVFGYEFKPQPGDVIRPTRRVTQIPVLYWEELGPKATVLVTTQTFIPTPDGYDLQDGRVVKRVGDKAYLCYYISNFDPHKII